MKGNQHLRTFVCVLGLLGMSMSPRPAAVAQDDTTAAVMPMAIDLPGCMELALEYNPLIRQADERVREAEMATRESGSSRRPQLQGRASYLVEQQERISSFGSGAGPDEVIWNAGLDATLSLFSGGQLKAAEMSRRHLEDAFDARRLAVEQDVLLSVARSYYTALLARRRIAVQEEAIRLLDLQLARARQRFDTGAGPKFDLLQADVALANAQPPLVRARNDYRVAVEELRQSIGLPYASGRDATGVVLADGWPAAAPLGLLEDVVGLAVTNRPEVTELNAQARAVEEEFHAASRGRAPTVQAVAGYEVLNDRFAGTGDDVLQGWGVGVRAGWPLWEGGAIRSRAAASRSRLHQLAFEQDHTRLVVEVETRRAWFNVEQAQEILLSADRVIEQAGEALRLAENRFRAGGITQLDVLQSQLELTRARLEKAQADHDYHVAHAELMRAQGLPLAQR